MGRRKLRSGESFSPILLGSLLVVLLLLAALASSGPWHLRHGWLFLCLGGLMLAFCPSIPLPKSLLIVLPGIALASWASFLPVNWFREPSWRTTLEELGVFTGDLVVIQTWLALESQLVFWALAIAGVWLLTLRFSLKGTRSLALAFVVAVTFYALFSKLTQGQFELTHGRETYGFFPNRNHTSNFLSVGFMVGIGAFFQSIRAKNFASIGIYLVCIALILWALFSWNISRSGVLLCLIGISLWVLGLGRRYFGRNEIRAFGLVFLLGVGVFFLNDFRVKERLSETMDRLSGDQSEDAVGGSSQRQLSDFDFRVPIVKDSMGLLGDYGLTGVGAGQFRWIYPQYRKETIVLPEALILHPESSWLWLAAEWGVPAALGVLAVVIFFYYQGYRNIKKRGNRERALRLGCLIASVLVPLHSLFDVPGHRPTLFLVAIVLYVISQNHEPDPTRGSSRVGSLAGRIGGGFVMLAGVFLVGSSWFGWGKPIAVAYEEELAEGAALYERIKKEESPMSPLKTLSMRKDLKNQTNATLEKVPLEGRLHRLRGLASLPMKAQQGAVAEAFAIDRALTPFSVRIPLIHAIASLPYFELEVARGWREAMERSRAIDSVRGDGAKLEESTWRRIEMSVRKNPRYLETASTVK